MQLHSHQFDTAMHVTGTTGKDSCSCRRPPEMGLKVVLSSLACLHGEALPCKSMAPALH